MGNYFTILFAQNFIWYVISLVGVVPLAYILAKVVFDRHKSETSIRRSEIILLASRNIRSKLSRTLVTIGGMAIGIGAIVFLVSMGYGLEKLVISRVARLEEMKQTNVTPQQGSRIKINDETLAQLNDIPNTDKVLPLISLVAKVSFQDSSSDMAVFGVTSDYLNHSAIRPVTGEIFDSNNLTLSTPSLSNQVQGAKDIKTAQEANRFFYDYYKLDSSMLPQESEVGEVLGETDNSDIDWVTLEEEAGDSDQEQIQTVSLTEDALKEAVVNRAMIRVLGMTEEEAVGKEFEVSFVVVGNLLQDTTEKIESIPAKYKIIGVTPEEETPFFYAPFIDLRSLGVVNYSEVKVITTNQDVLADVRQRIEVLGFVTSSVVDTVSQIESLFSTIRTILGLVGMVALSIAALGMFNTLTVSLLERTHEVGFMKAVGMKSHEVQELFLAESLAMSFLGGIVGLIFGYLGGKTISLVLTAFSLSHGGDAIDISYIPPIFILVVFALAIVVGVVTGYYPAQRSKRITALEALRYE